MIRTGMIFFDDINIKNQLGLTFILERGFEHEPDGIDIGYEHEQHNIKLTVLFDEIERISSYVTLVVSSLVKSMCCLKNS